MKKICLVFSTIIFLFVASFTNVNAQEAFIINNLNVVMDVHEDGSIDIVETFNLDFTENRHGIYRNLPNEYSMTWNIEGEDVARKYYFPVSNVKCSTKSCSIDKNDKGLIVKLGDEDKNVFGKNTMVLSYRVQTKDLDIDGIQMLYWNIAGNFDTTIENLNFTINMPKTIEKEKIYTYSGKYLSDANNIEVELKGNTITGKTLSPLNNYENATIQVELPNDYFTFPPATDFSLPIYIWYVVAGVIIAGLYFFLGRDDKVIKTIEFGPPKDLNSAEIGYIIDGTISNKDILSLIIEWANKGYLLIHERKKSFALEKVRDMDIAECKDYEIELFNALFSSKQLVEQDDLKGSDLTTAFAEVKTKLRDSFWNFKERHIYTSSSKVAMGVTILLVVLIQTIVSFTYAYDKYQLLELSIIHLIPGVINLAVLILATTLFQKRYTLKPSQLILFFIVFTAIVVGLQGFVIYTQYVDLKVPMLQILIGAAIVLISSFLILIMLKRSEKANLWLGQLLGLKDFIVRCEKEKLEMFVHENPAIFYEVLPYAYVLGVSDTWAKQFETIKMEQPDWYRTDNVGMFTSMIWWSSFHSSFNHMSASGAFMPAAHGGIGGGGFGGGGGFSGGGFGGGGGGSW